MALQADPTVQYAIFLATGKRKPRLYTRTTSSPRPTTPICTPGFRPARSTRRAGGASRPRSIRPRCPTSTSSPGPTAGTCSPGPTTSTCGRSLGCDGQSTIRAYRPCDGVPSRSRLDVVARARIPDTTATPAPAGREHRRHVLGPHPADRDAGPSRPRAARAERSPSGPSAVAGVGLGGGDPPGADAPVVRPDRRGRLVGRARPRRRSTNPGGAIAPGEGHRADRPGPRCTPAAPAASATSGRSFTSTGTRSAPTSARASATCSRGEALLEPELHRGHAAALRRPGERHEVAAGHQAVVGHEHQPNQRRYISLP